ncbi:MAG: methyl-accepting chemotaxis protein, partial [Lachnospiraceae bacterium]|nr:methyl-accepting chemotaxis protein [Lachnospiraceae bacterium]
LLQLNSIKSKLVVLMLLIAAIPLAVSVVTSYITSTSKAKADAKEALQAESNYLQSEFHTVVANTITGLKSLASSPNTIKFVETGDAEAGRLLKQQMGRVNECFDDENVIVLSNEEGMMILRSDESKLADIHDREYFQKALAGEANVSNIIISKSTNVRNICIAVPVTDLTGNKVIGVLHRSYDLDVFHELLAANAEEAFLIDGEGTLAAHSDYSIAAEDEPVSFKSSPYMTTDIPSDTFVSTANGAPTYVSYTKDSLSGFTVCNARPVSVITKEARGSALIIVLIGVIMLIIVSVISVLTANGFSKPILAVDGILSELANGRFKKISKYTERNDEFGDMVRNSNAVIDKLKAIVDQIKKSSYTVSSSSDGLSAMATQIAATSETVAGAVQQIAEGATEQALSIQQSVEHTGQITNAVENVQSSTNGLNDLAAQMKKASEESGEALNAFREMSQTMGDKINEITQKIASTQDAVSDINERITGISDVAAQTSLLSLNASIEAARAGDAGRGFTVVAEEIRKLADDSDSLAQEIKTVMSTLLNESAEAVTAAKEIIESNKKQEETLNETLSTVLGMLSDIEETVDSAKNISEETDRCVESNKVVTDAMASLSAISEENAASSETTGASCEELSATVTELANSADQLKSVAKVLIQNISFFK